MSVDFKTFYYRLGSGQPRERVMEIRKGFAERAGTTVRYIEAKLLRDDPTKRPDVRTKLMRGLAEATDGAFTFDDMINYFYRA